MVTTVHRWEKRDNETQRYYEAFVVRDLLGDQVLVTRWGGIGTAHGRSQQRLLTADQDVRAAMSRVDKQRTRRGYARCQPISV